jgi:hypothetical protein
MFDSVGRENRRLRQTQRGHQVRQRASVWRRPPRVGRHLWSVREIGVNIEW